MTLSVEAQPTGYRTYAVGSALVVTRPEYFLFLRDALHAHGSLYAHAALWPDATALQGRGVAYRIGTPFGEWVVRRGRRGGALARVLGDRYLRLGQPRQLRELMVSERARQKGVPTPEVKAVVLEASRLFVRGDVATEYIANSEDLAQLGFGNSTFPAHLRESAWRAAGRLVRELAAAGLRHRDLNLKNILVEQTAAEVRAWVLDLDRAELRGPTSAAAMWARLRRSLTRWEGTTGRSLVPAERAAFEAGYGG